VKPDTSDTPANSRFPLGPGDAYAPGSLLSATNQPLIAYIRFAFRLAQIDLPGLPAWVYSDRFDIVARAPGNPTKDQMRLMTQSLLADRFKLRTRSERRTAPVLNLVPAKAGRTGPQLQPHSKAESCSSPPTSASLDAGPAKPSAPSSTGGLQLPPIPCGSIGPVAASAPERGRWVGRDVTRGRIAGFLMNPYTGVDRPVVDRTGLTGTFDFSIEWSLPRDPAQPAEDTGPSFLEALREQLGLTLKRATGPVDILVVDHVEHPTED
jgi:uncharacterized protein (TIGR03435 family)